MKRVSFYESFGISKKADENIKKIIMMMKCGSEDKSRLEHNLVCFETIFKK